MSKKILLTGITGFIGSNLAKKLLEDGIEVHAIVRESSNLSLLDANVRENVVFHTHNAQNTLKDIVKKATPDVTIHLASLFLSSHKYEDVLPLITSNVAFGAELLEALYLNDAKSFINTGTAWQHYNNADYSPVNLYAATKQAFEDIVKYYEEAKGFKVIALKIYDTYGENDRRKKLLALLKETANSGEKLSMSKGEQKINLVHVEDIANAFSLAAKYLCDGRFDLCGSYALSSGDAISLQELVRRYEKLIGKKINIGWGEREYREREVMEPWNRGKILPGWERKHRELM